MGGVRLNLVGQKFGKLTVVSYAHSDRFSRSHWNCVCECGNTTISAGNNLKKGTAASCGLGPCHHQYKHGLRQHELYGLWGTIVQRCTNPNNSVWENYGGRGITICDRWRNSFEAFLEDMGERPSPTHEVDRIDNDLGYYKENCKWSTPKEQANNRRPRS